ncbi:MAG: hypothetical protein KJO40_04885 [Deltaproteobacteria bacterium]|nr:hypothetical protein [Deltaproteobacteria bacterium]NND27352.1 hypothetical protein [Myxococcales bacterium]NNK06839.1 hypothetical protein [Myxococcales bacterium]RZV49470.1 MAG: hypothetical protein EX268_19015 [Deltaproteobacteria bacterium]
MRRALGPVLLCLMVACSESFLPASAVDDLRVIGARIDVEGAPGRANPSPEDEVQASILVIDQGPLPALTWSFIACVPAPTRIGVPICGDLIEGCDGCVGPPPSDPFALPVLRFQVPPEEELDELEAREVLLLGVVCGEGVPSAEAIRELLSGESDDLASCEDAEGEPIVDEDERSVGRIVTVQIPIERDTEDPNLNPGIENVFLNESDWPPPYAEGVPREAPATGCKAALDALNPEDREKHPKAGSPPSTIDLSVTPGSLQSFTVDGEDFTEELQVSWLADGGGFEVAFSFITDPADKVGTRWQPFSEVPTDGRLVRFSYVIRDGRGGLDRVERGLCVLPPASPESPP